MGYLLILFLHPSVHLFSSAGVQLHQEPLLLLQDLWLDLTESKEPNNLPKCAKMFSKQFCFMRNHSKTSSFFYNIFFLPRGRVDRFACATRYITIHYYRHLNKLPQTATEPHPTHKVTKCVIVIVQFGLILAI